MVLPHFGDCGGHHKSKNQIPTPKLSFEKIKNEEQFWGEYLFDHHTIGREYINFFADTRLEET